MERIIRAEYQAVLKGDVETEALQEMKAAVEAVLHDKKQKNVIFTGGLFRHEADCFLYLEYIAEDEDTDVRMTPDEWFADIEKYFVKSEEDTGEKCWLYMQPVFWTDEPKSPEDWKRKIPPEHGCGRIAVLFPDKADSYVSHHLALSKEGLLVGDRYQFISKYGYQLFSYFETPRTNERVNLRRSTEPSVEIEKWDAVDPDSHFYHFPEAHGANFLIIETLCWVQ